MADQTLELDEIDAREAYILGQPPRIAPLGPDAFSAEALAVTGRLRQIGSGRPPPTDGKDVPEVVSIMLKHAALYDVHVGVGIQLMARGTLTPRDREIAILRIGWLCQAPFEWGEHVKKGKALGFTSDEIERIVLGSTAPEWNGHEAAILRGVEELHATAMITDATWATLAETFDEVQLIEFPILIGQYITVAFSQNTLRMRLGEGNVGLRAR